MKRLVLLGEGHGEVDALPILVGRLLAEKSTPGLLYLDRDIIREGPASLVKWDKRAHKPDYSGWIRRVELAARRRDVGGILAVYDGDAAMFPAGSSSPFCAWTAAASMAAQAVSAGAGELFSLAVVFVCTEYETWLIAGIESLAGRRLSDGRIVIPPDVKFPGGHAESHGKGWLMRNSVGYRPTRDQARLTELLDFKFVRAKKLGSFERLEHALDQSLGAIAKGIHVSTPS